MLKVERTPIKDVTGYDMQEGVKSEKNRENAINYRVIRQLYSMLYAVELYHWIFPVFSKTAYKHWVKNHLAYMRITFKKHIVLFLQYPTVFNTIESSIIAIARSFISSMGEEFDGKNLENLVQEAGGLSIVRHYLATRAAREGGETLEYLKNITALCLLQEKSLMEDFLSAVDGNHAQAQTMFSESELEKLLKEVAKDVRLMNLDIQNFLKQQKQKLEIISATPEGESQPVASASRSSLR